MRPEKKYLVEEAKSRLSASDFLFLVNFTGVTVKAAAEFREALAKAGAQYHVVKNSIIALAAKELGLPDMSEVLARMRAVLRRRGAGLEHNGVGSKTLTNGELTLDCEMKTVRVRRDGQSKEVALSRREYDVLEALLQRPGAILSRSALEDRVYVDGELPESNAIEFIIHGLRKKLGSSAIGNVRGLGWMVQRAKS